MAGRVYPALRYRDARQAISWLQEAFGLVPGEIVANDDGTIAHAELFHGDGAVLIGTARSVYPWDVPAGYGNTYVVIEDVDAHAARARAAGAEILYGPEDTDYGSREYGAKDVEGNVWSFGTYVPRTP
ncbi:MAG TPA: VOC family protein [Thermomicrobiales bacterium]|nr:VOC family protein [Thermomicrobiales bacterium]